MALKLTLSLALVLVSGTAITLPVQPAMAVPNTCKIITYYEEPELITEVGMRTTCPVSMSGRMTRYSEVITYGNGGPGGPGGGGSGNLPCEFVAAGSGSWSPQNTCQNLPTVRNR